MEWFLCHIYKLWGYLHWNLSFVVLLLRIIWLLQPPNLVFWQTKMVAIFRSLTEKMLNILMLFRRIQKLNWIGTVAKCNFTCYFSEYGEVGEKTVKNTWLTWFLFNCKRLTLISYFWYTDIVILYTDNYSKLEIHNEFTVFSRNWSE